MADLVSEINRLALIRARHQKLLQERKAAYLQWEAEHKPLIDELLDVGKKSLDCEEEVRKLTVAAFKVTLNTKPAVGVAIRMMKVLTYEKDKALQWGLKTGLAIKLDLSAFEKIARATKLDFVTVSEEPAATISEDLHALLVEAQMEQEAAANSAEAEGVAELSALAASEEVSHDPV